MAGLFNILMVVFLLVVVGYPVLCFIRAIIRYLNRH